MGNAAGKEQRGRLSKKDIERLQRRFGRVAVHGLATINDFQKMVELGGNPFVPRIFSMFDADKDGKLNVREFTAALEFCSSGLQTEEEQYKFVFAIYDMDKDGFITSSELYENLKLLMGNTFSESQLEHVVFNTMMEYDQDGDQKLSFEEFKQLLSATDIANKFGF